MEGKNEVKYLSNSDFPWHTDECRAVSLHNIDLSLRRIAEALEHPPSLRDLEQKLADANIENTRLRMGQGVAK